MNDKWQPAFGFDDCEVISEKKLYQGHIVHYMTEFKFKLFNGGVSRVLNRERIDKRHAAAVLLFSPKQDSLLMIEQCRHAVIGSGADSPWLLDVVAGHIEDGDTAEETGIKESKEEAGVKVNKLIRICDYLASCGHSNEKTTLFCGLVDSDMSGGDVLGVEAEDEDIKTHLIKVDDAFDLLNDGKILTAAAVISLMWLKSERHNFQSI